MSVAEMRQSANIPWNLRGKLPLHKWLAQEHGTDEGERLKEVGNAVIPACGRLALHAMGHFQELLLASVEGADSV